MNLPTTFALYQVMRDPRTQEARLYPFGEYVTLDDAREVAKRELKRSRWAIFEQKPVALSSSLKAELKAA